VLVLDLERHENLVTASGAKLDGSLGLRPPRQPRLRHALRVQGWRGRRGHASAFAASATWR